MHRGQEQKGLFGDLTLRRVKATGHAVWLQQPAEGSKIFCNEMIHEVAPPGGQGRTYFRGDSTRKHWMLEKFDFAEERPEGPDGPARRTVQSVTHVWTTDATVVDNDGDMGQADPRRPRARPARDPAGAEQGRPARSRGPRRPDRDLAGPAPRPERARPRQEDRQADPHLEGEPPGRRPPQGLVARRRRQARRLAQAQAGRGG